MDKSSSLKNMVIVLSLVAMIAAIILGSVYMLTKETIEKIQANQINLAISKVVPAFDNNPLAQSDTIIVDDRAIYLFHATNNNEWVGTAIETSTTKGFSGLITLMVGFLPDGTIYNTAVISHAETPGLGDKIDKSKGNFAIQFDGKNPETFKLAVKKDGGDVDAITASTISSRAFCDAIERAYKAFQIKYSEK